MEDLYIWALASALLGLGGGAAHILLPPFENDKLMWIRRMLAGAVVGALLFLMGDDPSGYAVPSTAFGAWIITIISAGYFSLDVLKWLIEKFKQQTGV